MAGSQAAEEHEKTDQGPTDHGPSGGEDPVTDRDPLGLLGHGLEFVEENLGVEFPGDFGAKLVNGRGDHLAFRLLE